MVAFVALFPKLSCRAQARHDVIGLVRYSSVVWAPFKDQARLKPDELALAGRTDARFALSRRIPDSHGATGSDARFKAGPPMASGSMNGFGEVF